MPAIYTSLIKDDIHSFCGLWKEYTEIFFDFLPIGDRSDGVYWSSYTLSTTPWPWRFLPVVEIADKYGTEYHSRTRRTNLADAKAAEHQERRLVPLAPSATPWNYRPMQDATQRFLLKTWTAWPVWQYIKDTRHCKAATSDTQNFSAQAGTSDGVPHRHHLAWTPVRLSTRCSIFFRFPFQSRS